MLNLKRSIVFVQAGKKAARLRTFNKKELRPLLGAMRVSDDTMVAVIWRWGGRRPVLRSSLELNTINSYALGICSMAQGREVR